MDVAVAGLLTLLEPIMIALLGGVVGGIVIAMYHADLRSDQQDDGMSLRPRLLTLIAVRVVASTLLLGWAVLIQLSRPGSFPIDPFFFLIGLTYGLNVLYLATLRFAEDHGWLIDLQFAVDALVVSAFIHLTGGITSYFSSLYLLPIIAASAIRFGRTAIQVATLSAVLYLALVTAQYVPHDYLPDAAAEGHAGRRSAVAAGSRNTPCSSTCSGSSRWRGCRDPLRRASDPRARSSRTRRIRSRISARSTST